MTRNNDINKESIAYKAGWNDYVAGNPFTTGDELWDIFKHDWQQGWADARESDYEERTNAGKD